MKTYKKVVSAVKHDLADLLGYEHSGLFLHNEEKDSLYSISLDDEQMKAEEQIDTKKHGFEHEYIV